MVVATGGRTIFAEFFQCKRQKARRGHKPLGWKVSKDENLFCNDDEIQLWLRNEELGERWYDIYQLKRLTDENVKKALENAEDDNEANPAAVYDEIRRLLNVEINAFGN